MSALAGAQVLIVGGSSGIGFAVAAALIAEGAEVTIASSNPEKVAGAEARLGRRAHGLVLDVRDEASVEAGCGELDRIDHLVYTAGDWGGARQAGRIDGLDLGAAPEVFAVRFWGAIAVIKHALDKLAGNASITLTNGAIAHRPRPGAALSSAMAGAIEHLTRALAIELAPRRVNCVCPGYVVTEVWDGMPEAEREKFLADATAHQPLARAAAPEEIAEAYLHSMRASYATGQIFINDGGFSLV